MKTEPSTGSGAWASSLLQLLLLLAVPAAAQAQFRYTTNNGTITLTQYTDSSAREVPIIIPRETNGLPVTTIAGYAFSEAAVTSVTIPDSVTSIGDYAFDGCYALTNVIIPNGVLSIGEHAFDQCVRLASVTIPNSVISIGESAFTESGLTNVTIGSGLTGIQDHTFDCPFLTNVTIGSSVNSIGEYAFGIVSGLRGLYFQGNAPYLSSNAGLNPPWSTTTVYYLPGTGGWGSTFGGRPAVLWNPQVQAGSYGVRSNQFGFTITGRSNLVVVIEASTNLANPAWNPLQTSILTSGSAHFSDPQWTNYPGRFYRLRWP